MHILSHLYAAFTRHGERLPQRRGLAERLAEHFGHQTQKPTAIGVTFAAQADIVPVQKVHAFVCLFV